MKFWSFFTNKRIFNPADLRLPNGNLAYFDVLSRKKIDLLSWWHNWRAGGRVKRYFNLHIEKSKTVIYTCITGGQDALWIPDFINYECDYVCFCDDRKLLSRKMYGPWKIKPLHLFEKDAEYTRIWHKMNPHILFSDYQFSLYCDANINFKTGKIFEYIRSVPKRCFIALSRSDLQDSAYEADCLSNLRNGKHGVVISDQIRFYRQNNFPEHFGIIESNIIFRRHHHRQCIDLMEKWWNLFSRYPAGDQLSLSYLLWNEQVEYAFFAPYSFQKDCRNFRVHKHRI